MSVFFTSDLHFGHDKLCRDIRGMSSDESDRLIIERWNGAVSKDDMVFILGDVTDSSPKVIHEVMPLLNGRKHVVLGNHDSDCAVALLQRGCVISGVTVFADFALSHVPIIKEEATCFGLRGNIHGHIHKAINFKELDPEIYYNVNVEFHDYTPVRFEEIDQHFKRSC